MHGLKYSTALALWELVFIDKTDASGKCKGLKFTSTSFQNFLNTLSGYCLHPRWVLEREEELGMYWETATKQSSQVQQGVQG